MAANDTQKIKLPSSVVSAIIGKVKDTSTIATLSPGTPQKFADTTYLVFNPTAEAEVVAEGGMKSGSEISTTPIVAKRAKIVTTTRVSDELKWADEDNQLEIISNIIADQTAAAGRALDYIVYHAINPKTGLGLTGYTALTTDENVHSVTKTDSPVDDIDSLSDALLDYGINGIAMSRQFASELRKLRVPATGQRLYPEVPLSLNVGSLDGIPAAVSGTVSGIVNGRLTKTPAKVSAIMGDFSAIKWGMVRDITAEVIEYGDPDNTGHDLKGYNQIAYRTEAVLAYAVLDPKAFAVLKSA
ncbi:MAG: phage major capsid protein [Collinsella intestinalis]